MNNKNINDEIIIKGARVNNLKNINLTIPKNKFVVFTGLSGSGKSSLAFDTIYAEGHRRYLESLSSYSRQFLGGLQKPDVDSITGLAPSIAIDQKSTSKNPRSTVGTITEIYDYLRLLWARVGIPHCPICGIKITKQTTDQITDKILGFDNGTKIMILAPIVRGKKGGFVTEIENSLKNGYLRLRIDGKLINLTETKPDINKNKKHNIEVVVDRFLIDDFIKEDINVGPMHGFGNISKDKKKIIIKEKQENLRSRIAQAVESALNMCDGFMMVNIIDKNEDLIFSKNYSCPIHNINVAELEPRLFSFNSPFGACPKCTGLGIIANIDPELLIPDKSLTIDEGGIKGSGISESSTFMRSIYKALGEKYDFLLNVPIYKIKKSAMDIILYGTSKEEIEYIYKTKNGQKKCKTTFEGVIPSLQRRFKETKSNWIRDEIQSLMTNKVCSACNGKKLSQISLSVKVGDIGISDFCNKSVKNSIKFIKELKFNEKKHTIASPILNEIISRLNFLNNIGLDYLSLDRPSQTLSGGEAQRIRLASQIGSGLTGVIYVLDEPSIGLHQKDNQKLIKALISLRDLGNTLIVVEHDEETMKSCDLLVDIGPRAGEYGGEIVAVGNVKSIQREKRSITGMYLSGEKKILVPQIRRKSKGELHIKGANKNNLKNLNVEFKFGVINLVTGVSGSGKSTLVNEVLYEYLNEKLIQGIFDIKLNDYHEYIDKIINIDQSPIGRTPRSNTATYTGIFTDIREIFALTPEAKSLGYGSNRFSFNVKGGRCEACQGDGSIKIEMHFLPDVYVNCDICKGKRYSRETLSIKYKDKNINDVLNMTVKDAQDFFYNIPKIKNKLQVLNEIGLSYIKLGQAATTLSGGEAQRIKLSTELSKRSTGKTLYILDEPTTGLHIEDVHKLIIILQKLCDLGNTLVIIEHNLDLIKIADHIIDLGPNGGDEGGSLVACGTPEEVSNVNLSYTGKYLKEIL